MSSNPGRYLGRAHDLANRSRHTEDLVAGMGLGADDYLVKPFALRELLARVRPKIEPSIRTPGHTGRAQ